MSSHHPRGGPGSNQHQTKPRTAPAEPTRGGTVASAVATTDPMSVSGFDHGHDDAAGRRPRATFGGGRIDPEADGRYWSAPPARREEILTEQMGRITRWRYDRAVRRRANLHREAADVHEVANQQRRSGRDDASRRNYAQVQRLRRKHAKAHSTVMQISRATRASLGIGEPTIR